MKNKKLIKLYKTLQKDQDTREVVLLKLKVLTILINKLR